jgi:hypothetical protein
VGLSRAFTSLDGQAGLPAERETAWQIRGERAYVVAMATVGSLFRAAVLDVLAPSGFTRVPGETIAARAGDGVLHHVGVSAEGDGFSVHFAAQPLWIPEAHFVVQPGGNVSSTKLMYAASLGAARVYQFAYLRANPSVPGAVLDNGYLWPREERAIAPIARTLKSRVLPWLDGARDAAGLLAVLEHEQWKSQHHQHFARASALARLDRVDDARAAVASAIAGYEADVAERPGAAWCTERIALCRELAAALDAGAHQELLARRAAATLAALVPA